MCASSGERLHSHHDNVLELASASHSVHKQTMDIQEHLPLAPLTTFGIGGLARFFARARTVAEIAEALAFAKEKNLSVCILGGGSNTLFDDAGFQGLVIKIEVGGITLERDGDGALLVAGAGESWDAIVARAVGENLWGVENLSAIPGTIGGAVVQNIGAYGAALSQTLAWAEVYDTQKKEITKLSGGECAFGYRDSIFKRHDGRYVILRAALRLLTALAPDLSYRDLAEKFKDTSPSLVDIREAVIAIRKNKFPDMALEGTAGSFFKNPVLPKAQTDILASKYPGMPLFSLPESSDTKVPLGWILDHALNVRGMRIGSARLFEKQALVIVTEKNGSSKDVAALAKEIQNRVRDAIGIAIEPEVRVVAQ